MSQTTLNLTAPPSYGTDDFIVSDCNRLAYEQLLSPQNWPSYGAILLGPEASGKTHLLHIFAVKTGAMWMDLAADLALPDTPMVIDNADSERSAESEQHLFHLLNHSKNTGKPILLATSKPPQAWEVKLPDLLSRLKSLPVFALEAPDEILLTALLAKYFSDQQLMVEPQVMHYIITRTERSFEAVQRTAEALNQYALEHGRAITTALVRRWMEETA